MNIFRDYQSWLYENNYLISLMKENNSIIYQHLTPVFTVLNYLSKVNNKTDSYEAYELDIFHTGFYYLHDQFNYIKLIWENNLQCDIDEFIRLEKTILLLLNALDFENDLENPTNTLSKSLKNKGLKQLSTFQDEVVGYLQKKEIAPEQLNAILDQITINIYQNNDYISTLELFFQIALEYDLV